MSYPFVQARWYRVGGNTPINRIVIHDMEYPEKLTSAEDVARYFQRVEKKTSAHYCVDTNSVVQCVKNGDGAYHAPPNQYSIGIEHAGYARQTKAEWLDEYGTAMLRDQSAPLVKLLMREYNIPHVWLSVQDLRDGKRGITSHNNVSLAFGQSTHTDPGPNFPVTEFMAWCQPDSGPVIPPVPLPGLEYLEEPIMPVVAQWKGAVFLVDYDMASGQCRRRTFPNPSRLGQVMHSQGVYADRTKNPYGEAFPVLNDQFEQVYQDLGVA